MTVEYKTLSSKITVFVTKSSREREQVRQKKLGKLLEWDVDKPSVDDDGLIPECFKRANLP